MKQLLLTLFAIFLLNTTVSAVEDSYRTFYDYDGVEYVLNYYSQTACAHKYALPTKSVIVIPSIIIVDNIEFHVTSIGREAFENCHHITSFTIGNKVKSIDESAFAYCI